MTKLDQVTRDKAIDYLADISAGDEHPTLEEFRDLHKYGLKGYVDQTDQELYNELRALFDDWAFGDENCADLLAEMKIQLEIDQLLTS